MKKIRQTTLRERVSLSGAGVHSNAPVQLLLHPAEVNHGIVFLRTGLDGGATRVVEATWSQVSMTELCTVIGDASEGSVATIEHLMAAVAGLGIDNLLIEIDGPEVPIMDGSSAHFVEAIDEVGIVEQDAPRRSIRVLKPVRVEIGRGFAELLPATSGFHLDVEIDFNAGVIGRQQTVMELTPAVFRREISRARTFGFLRDVERLWKAGFALGASLDNTIALEDERVINPEGLRYEDEFVRHKLLDAIGDLSLAGAPLIAHYRSYCCGHKLNHAVLEALFADPDAYEIVSDEQWRRPVRVQGARVAAHAAFAPDTN